MSRKFYLYQKSFPQKLNIRRGNGGFKNTFFLSPTIANTLNQGLTHNYTPIALSSWKVFILGKKWS